jgi:hypothetical protein
VKRLLVSAGEEYCSYKAEELKRGSCFSSFRAEHATLANIGGGRAYGCVHRQRYRPNTHAPPDCSAAFLNRWQDLYCNRRQEPDSAQVRATLQALDQIATRGEECAAIAQRGRDLLATGQITFFVWQEGGSGGYGHRNTGIQLDEGYARHYGTQGSRFERVLVHEIDHYLGHGHIDSSGLETPHTAQCG